MRPTMAAAATLLASAGCVPAGEGLRLETEGSEVQVEKLCAQAATPGSPLPDRLFVRIGGRRFELKRLCPQTEPDAANAPQG